MAHNLENLGRFIKLYPRAGIRGLGKGRANRLPVAPATHGRQQQPPPGAAAEELNAHEPL